MLIPLVLSVGLGSSSPRGTSYLSVGSNCSLVRGTHSLSPTEALDTANALASAIATSPAQYASVSLLNLTPIPALEFSSSFVGEGHKQRLPLRSLVASPSGTLPPHRGTAPLFTFLPALRNQTSVVLKAESSPFRNCAFLAPISPQLPAAPISSA